MPILAGPSILKKVLIGINVFIELSNHKIFIEICIVKFVNWKSMMNLEKYTNLLVIYINMIY